MRSSAGSSSRRSATSDPSPPETMQPSSQAPPPPPLDPPFRGYIESTLDALLVLEAARRGMIPRVTRRLIERERGMVQSGAVFVFDEHESGIKRWTDGMVWSPSRILGNFLVYRETDKRPPTTTPTTPTTPDASMLMFQNNYSIGGGIPFHDPTRPGPIESSSSPSSSNVGAGAHPGSGSGSNNHDRHPPPPPPPPPPVHSQKPQLSAASVSGLVQPTRPRSSSEGYGRAGIAHAHSQAGGAGGGVHGHAQQSGYATTFGPNGSPVGMGPHGHVQVVVERQKERSLVGSLTGSYKFKEGGLVKKTMSVNVNGFAQHMVSYYSVEDVVANRLRTPSSLPELLALDISPEYLHKQNFRCPPLIEVGPDGIPRYAGEPEEAASSSHSGGVAHPSGYSSLSARTDPLALSLTPGLARPKSSGSTMMSPLTPSEYNLSGTVGAPGFFEIQQMQHLAHSGGAGEGPPSGIASSSQYAQHSGPPSLAQVSSHIMRPPHSAGPGTMIRQASDSGLSNRSDRRSGMTIKGSYRYDPYGYTPPNTGPVQSSAVTSSSLPSHYAESFAAMSGPSHRRQSDSYGPRPVIQQPYSPPSPLHAVSSGGAGSGRSSMSFSTGTSAGGYLNAEGLEVMPEMTEVLSRAVASMSYPGPAYSHGAGGSRIATGTWSIPQGSQVPPPHLRPHQGIGFKGNPVQTSFGIEGRYTSIGTNGFPSSPLAQAQGAPTDNGYHSISDGLSAVPNGNNGGQLGDDQLNLAAYPESEPTYHTPTNVAWGRDQVYLVPEQMAHLEIEHKPTMISVGESGPAGEVFYHGQQYEAY